MPYQNKVDPEGNIHAVKSKGLFLGNRGILHNQNQEIIATHRIKGWVTCLTEFKVGKRAIIADRSRFFVVRHDFCFLYLLFV